MRMKIFTMLLAFTVLFGATANAQEKAIKRTSNQGSEISLGSQEVAKKGAVSTEYTYKPSITNQKGKAALNEGFEGTVFPPDGWALYNGGDAGTWVRYTTTPYSGVACAAISFGSTAHNDYLITPKLAITSGNNTLTAWMKSQSSSFLEPYDVMVSTTGTAPADFTVFQAMPDPGTVWVQKTWDLSAYNDQNIYVAFRSTTTDMFRLFIDDVAGPEIFALADDAGVMSINLPGAFVPGVIAPKATVKNFGSTAQDFSVAMVINDGDADIYTESVDVTALDATTTLQVTFPDWTAALGSYTVTVTVTNADDMDNSNDEISKVCVVEAMAEAYVGNASLTQYSKFNLTDGTEVQVGTIGTTPFPMAEEFAMGTIYRIYNDFKFGTVALDGSFTLLGTMTGATGTPTGLAYDWDNDMFYVNVLDASSLPQLCTLNTSTYALTLIGTGTEGSIIGFDFANDGFLYGPALNDNLYKVDPATGVVTLIGALGRDINYGQDVSYDPQDELLLTITCGAAGAARDYGYYDLTTGAFTVLVPKGTTSQYATFVVAKEPLPTYDVTFTVHEGLNLIEGATITVGSKVLTTDVDGEAVKNFINGTYNFTVEKFGYEVYEGTFTVVDDVELVDVELVALTIFDVTFNIENVLGDPLDATVTAFSGAVEVASGTATAGEIVFTEVPVGTYTYNVVMEGYTSIIGVELEVTAAVSVPVVMVEPMDTPYGLGVVVEGNNALFSWNKTYGFSDDFESYPDFSLTFAPWILNDVDASTTYGMVGVTFLNSGSPMAGIIFNPSTTTPAITTSPAHSGSKYLAIFNATSMLDDDWVIAPMVDIRANEQVSFWARGGSATYVSEKFQVFVSTTGTAPADFTAISPVVTTPSTTWAQYTYSLNDYAGQKVHVAIRCTSEDQFYLCIDDFEIGQPVKNAKSFEGYTVELDGVEVATGVTDESYLFEDLTPGTYTAGVKSIYTTGETELVTIDFVIEDSYTVTFNVVDEASAPVADATISFDGVDYPTGQYVFTGIYAGTYSYAVYKEGYDLVEGTVTVTNADVVEPITLIVTGLNNNTLTGLSTYPNPFSNQITISNPSLVSRMVIANLVGQVVLDVRTNGAATVETANLSTGIYLVTFEAANGDRIVRKMIKK